MTTSPNRSTRMRCSRRWRAGQSRKRRQRRRAASPRGRRRHGVAGDPRDRRGWRAEAGGWEQATYRSLLEQFARNKATATEDPRCAENGDRALAERLAHTLKGVAGNIGMAAVQAAAASSRAVSARETSVAGGWRSWSRF